TAGDRSVEARCIQVVGIDLVRQGDLGAASGVLARAEEVMRRAHQHSALASLLQWHADQQAARASRLFATTNDEWGLATAMGFRAQVALEIGDTAHAHALYSQLLAWSTKDRQLLAIADARLGLADVAVRARDFDTATRELAAG